MNGILIVDKPKGLTSHDVVDIIRRRFKLKKVGHAGALDPSATGVLVILTGSATKLSNALINADKEYQVKCLLGIVTDTDDLEGKIQSRIPQVNPTRLLSRSWVDISRQEFDNALLNFKGRIKQKVPRYSAVKLKGKKLYELARKNQNFELPERIVTIYNIEVIKFNLPQVTLKINCSKGTYIRALCRDLGQILGCGGCVSELRRMKSEPFSIDNAVKLQILRTVDNSQLSKFLKPITIYESLQKFISTQKD